MRRPKRLWLVVLVNVAAGSLTLAAAGYLFVKVLPGAGAMTAGIVPSVLLGGVLITSSILALLGRRPSRWVALGSATLFFGFHSIESLWLYYHPSPALPLDTASLASSVERNLLGLVLNLWAFLSDKTEAFFDAAGPDSRWTGRESS